MATTEHSPKTGSQLRDQGIADVLDADHAVNRGVREHVEHVLDELIESGRPFCADDVHRLLPQDVQPHSPHLIPALFRTYAVREQIRQVGWATSTRPTRHAGVVRMWIGAAHIKAAA